MFVLLRTDIENIENYPVISSIFAKVVRLCWKFDVWCAGLEKGHVVFD
jgi:hypothetical protein